ncbi:MAG: hypothetical protein ACI4SV_05435, partial [Duodenibacillus sp.]
SMASSTVKGLPAGAGIQTVKGKRYVFFTYSFRSEGRIKQERDYIGTVDENDCFVPNHYYTTAKPTRAHRDPTRWKDPVKRAQALGGVTAVQSPEEKPPKKSPSADFDGRDFDLPKGTARCVGPSALAVVLLYKSGLIEDLGRIFSGDVDTVVRFVNAGVSLALGAGPLYADASDRDFHQFVGLRGSSMPDFASFRKAAEEAGRLSEVLTAARLRRVSGEALLSLDGSFGEGLEFSVLASAVDGRPVGVRLRTDAAKAPAPGEPRSDASDACRLPVIPGTGALSEETLIRWHQAGSGFFVETGRDHEAIRTIIKAYQRDLHSATRLVRHRHCYGIKEAFPIEGTEGKAPLTLYVFRSPTRETDEMEAFLGAIERVEAHWMEGTLTDEARPFLKYFVNPRPSMPLERNQALMSEDCRYCGCVVLLGNIDEKLPAVLDRYAQRKEVEKFFRLMMGRLLNLSSDHSVPMLEALTVILLVGLTVFAELRALMAKTPTPGLLARLQNKTSSVLTDLCEPDQVLERLQRVMMRCDSRGKLQIPATVTRSDCVLMEALGIRDLFDDPENAAKLFSPAFMKDNLGV